MSYYIYYQPQNVEEGHAGAEVIKCATKEEAFLEQVRLRDQGNIDIKVLQEVTLKVELA